MGKKCVFLDSLDQQIAYKRLDDSAYAEVAHENEWYVRVPQKVLNQIKAANTAATIISPYSFLYLQYTKRRKESVLWLVVLENHLFLITFQNGRALYAKSYDIDSKELAEIITEFLHEFYATEESFFVEEIEIFYEEGSLYEDPDLEERFLLPVTFIQLNKEKICSDPNLSHYYFQIRGKNAPVSIGISKKFVFGVGGAILFLLILIDAFLKYKVNKYDTMTKDLVRYQVELANESNEAKSKILKTELIKPIVNELRDSNELIDSKIKSLFDLVPDDLYLTEFLLKDNMLYIEGVTKKKSSFIEQLHKKISQTYQKSSYKLQHSKQGYKFVASYEEVTG